MAIRCSPTAVLLLVRSHRCSHACLIHALLLLVTTPRYCFTCWLSESFSCCCSYIPTLKAPLGTILLSHFCVMFLLLLLLFILLLFHTAARMRCSCTEAFTLVLIHSSFHAALFWHFCSHGTTTALLLLHISPTIALSSCFHTVILLMHAALTLLLFNCCFCTAAHTISTTSVEFPADPVCQAVSGAISDGEELANDLETCAAVCKDFKVNDLVFSQLTGCTEGLLYSQSRQ